MTVSLWLLSLVTWVAIPLPWEALTRPLHILYTFKNTLILSTHVRRTMVSILFLREASLHFYIQWSEILF